MERTRTLLAGLVAAVTVGVTTGCGDDDLSSSDTANTGLRNADEVQKEQEAANATVVTIGDFGELADGTRVQISRLDVKASDEVPTIVATMRVENPSSEDSSIPDVGIICANADADERGGWMADSMLALGDDLPAGSFQEGTLALELPDPHWGRPIPECVGPAYVEMEPSFYVGEQHLLRVEIPDQTLADMNAAAHN